MQCTKHVVIVAGEESGDMHAALCVKQLKINLPNLKITGIGGRHMQSAGVELISDLARFGVTGFSEVLKHFSTIKKALRAMQAHLIETKPDLLVLVDYPGFNLRLAKFAKRQLGLKILYYISPQIWAWKANRIHLIRECVDKMAVIFPFEKTIYEKAQVPVSFVGHPLTQTIHKFEDIDSLKNQLSLPLDKKIIALLPGSRTHEMERHMPVLVQTAVALHKNHSDIHFVIPVAGTLSISKLQGYFKNIENLAYTLVQGQAIEVLNCSDLVAVASGTASFECALLEKPMCIFYKTSLLTYMLSMQVIQVKYIGLCNLLADAMIVSELLQDDFNVKNLTQCLSNLLADQMAVQNMVNRLRVLKSKLSLKEADCSISELILQELSG